ncbi:hypothetical protein WJ01_23195 [Burkholderia vietnamiensis]|nr:hypothetical protein WJ01_23195 [Burkholderia vietnamiensis]
MLSGWANDKRLGLAIELLAPIRQEVENSILIPIEFALYGRTIILFKNMMASCAIQEPIQTIYHSLITQIAQVVQP